MIENPASPAPWAAEIRTHGAGSAETTPAAARQIDGHRPREDFRANGGRGPGHLLKVNDLEGLGQVADIGRHCEKRYETARNPAGFAAVAPETLAFLPQTGRDQFLATGRLCIYSS